MKKIINTCLYEENILAFSFHFSLFHSLYTALEIADKHQDHHQRKHNIPIDCNDKVGISYKLKNISLICIFLCFADETVSASWSTYDAILNAEPQLILDVRSFDKHFYDRSTGNNKQSNQNLRANSLRTTARKVYRARAHHLPYEATQCYMPADRGESALPEIQPERPVLESLVINLTTEREKINPSN